jgi:hypothetical protein
MRYIVSVLAMLLFAAVTARADFAIFYEPVDLAVMQLYIKDNVNLLTQADQQLASNVLDGRPQQVEYGGVGTISCEQFDPENKARLVVIKGGTLAEFRNLLLRIGNTIQGGSYLVALANDMLGCAGAVEPWPQSAMDDSFCGVWLRRNVSYHFNCSPCCLDCGSRVAITSHPQEKD